MPSFFVTYAKELVSAGVTIGLWYLNRRLQPKANLEYAVPHGFTFLVNHPYTDERTNTTSPTTMVHTRSFLIRNAGSQTASKVELIFNWEPQHINLWPVRAIETVKDQHSRYVVKLENLAPKESLGIEILAIQPNQIPELLNVRSEQAVGRLVNVTLSKLLSPWMIKALQILVIVGGATVIYLLITTIQFLVLHTPGGVAPNP